MDHVSDTDSMHEDDDEPKVQRKYTAGLSKKDRKSREAEIRRRSKETGDGEYRDFKSNFDSEGKRIKTKRSKHSRAYDKIFGDAMDEARDMIDVASSSLYESYLAGESTSFETALAATSMPEIEALAEAIVELLHENYEKAVRNKADQTGISYRILKAVGDRGMAAWKTGHRPGATQVQWALARINSFVTGGKTTEKADLDLAIKAGIRNKDGSSSKKHEKKLKAKKKAKKTESIEELYESNMDWLCEGVATSL